MEDAVPTHVGFRQKSGEASVGSQEERDRSDSSGAAADHYGNGVDGMGRMDRMRKILLTAPGSAPQRPKELKGNSTQATVASRAAVPLSSLGGQGRGPLRRRDHLPSIRSILPILSKQFPSFRSCVQRLGPANHPHASASATGRSRNGCSSPPYPVHPAPSTRAHGAPTTDARRTSDHAPIPGHRSECDDCRSSRG